MRNLSVAVVLATGLLGGVVAAVLDPTLIPARALELVPRPETTRRVTYVGALSSPLVLYVGWRILRRIGWAATPPGEPTADSAETVPGDTGPTAALDETIAAALDTPDDAERDAVRDTVRDLVVETLIREFGHEESRARTQVETGEWATDPRASAFVGGPQAPVPGLLVRLLDWLSVEGAYARRLEASVSELERIVENGDANGPDGDSR